MKKSLTIFLMIIITVLLVPAEACAQKEWQANKVGSGIVDPSFGYMVNWNTFYHAVPNPGPDQVYPTLAALLTAYGFADLNQAHAAGFEYYKTGLEGLTDQIWAVQVEAAPGERATLRQSFEAAYGPYGGILADSKSDIPPGDEDKWFFQPDEDGVWGVTAGDEYVGNYFTIDQLAETSGGQIKRYISISSPWSHAFVEEDMTITGAASITDAFSMNNLDPGDLADLSWWGLF